MPVAKYSRLWGRLLILAITGAALSLVFRRLNLEVLADTFRRMHWGWFIGAVVLYGVLFLPAALRWHIVLRLTGQSVHPGAATRLSLIGHFFYTMLLGVFGGDSAKAAVYAKWYRLSLAEVLATAPLDRLLGFAGLVLFSVIALTEAASAGAFGRVKGLSLQWHGAWVVLVVFGALTLLAGRWVGTAWPAWHRFTDALGRGAKVLLRKPRAAVSGVICGVLVQVALSGALALNLRAASHAPLPWGQLLWTFPVVVTVSALPFTFAGLGAREGAALALFGIYGVSREDAVGASLLTVATSLSWAVIGGILFWRERRWQRLARTVPKTISVIITTLDEPNLLKETLERALRVPEVCEVIVSDGGRPDSELKLATDWGRKVIRRASGGGVQMQRSAAEAKGDVILFLHADTWLPQETGRAVINCLRDPSVSGGGFWTLFRESSPLWPASWLKCAVRFYLGGCIAGEQAIFVRREVLAEIGEALEGAATDKVELSGRLRRVGRLALVDAIVTNSAREFAKRQTFAAADLCLTQESR